jgi:DNA-binding transcriptional LysR family regulator
VSRRLCAVAFHCVARLDYLRQCDAADAAGAPLPAMILPNLLQFGRLKMPVARVGLAPSQAVAMKSSDATLSYHAVMAGMGAAFLPDARVAGDLAQGRFVHVRDTGERFTGELYAVYLSRRHLPPKLRSFTDFLHAHLGP